MGITMDKLLRRKQIIDSLPYETSKHFIEVKAGRFPQAIYRGPKMAFWRESEVIIMNNAYIRGVSDEELIRLSRDIEARRTMAAQ